MLLGGPGAIERDPIQAGPCCIRNEAWMWEALATHGQLILKDNNVKHLRTTNKTLKAQKLSAMQVYHHLCEAPRPPTHKMGGPPWNQIGQNSWSLSDVKWHIAFLALGVKCMQVKQLFQQLSTGKRLPSAAAKDMGSAAPMHLFCCPSLLQGGKNHPMMQSSFCCERRNKRWKGFRQVEQWFLPSWEHIARCGWKPAKNKQWDLPQFSQWKTGWLDPKQFENHFLSLSTNLLMPSFSNKGLGLLATLSGFLSFC